MFLFLLLAVTSQAVPVPKLQPCEPLAMYATPRVLTESEIRKIYEDDNYKVNSVEFDNSFKCEGESKALITKNLVINIEKNGACACVSATIKFSATHDGNGKVVIDDMHDPSTKVAGCDCPKKQCAKEGCTGGKKNEK